MKAFLKKLCPESLLPKAWAERYLNALHERGVILGGPFKGMNFSGKQIYSLPIPKFLGTYEMELHSTIEKLCHKNYHQIIDVGAAEGYYAVGFAIRCPETVIVAFETLEEGQSLIREQAMRNQVENRVQIKGKADCAQLRSEVSQKTLIIMDVEGAENELLDPLAIPRLQDADLLVEVHEALRPGTLDRLTSRFQETHALQVIPSLPRTLSDFPRIDFAKAWILKYYFCGWLTERANPCCWLVAQKVEDKSCGA